MSEEVAVYKNTRKKKKKTSSTKPAQDDIPLSSMDEESAKQTKDAFEHLMHQVLLEQDEGTKSTSQQKKNKKNKEQQQMLERLRKGEGIKKDEEDQLLKANVYDPDDVKSKKSNKRRQRELEQSTAADNPSFEKNEEDKYTTVGKGSESVEKDVAIEQMSATYSVTTETPTTKKKTKARKKPPPPSHTDQTEQETSFVESKNKQESGEEKENAEQTATTSTTKEKPPRRKRKPKKKKVPTDEAIAAYAAALAEPEEEKEQEEVETKVEDTGLILALTIHRTDRLKTDFHIFHPLVRVHVVDLESGQMMKKQTKSRPVASYYEEANEKVDMMLPILTQPFDFRKNKSTLPVWEELLIWNENFNYLVHPDNKVLLLFEVLDFVSMNAAGQRYASAHQEGGWHKIAWAFLKLVGGNGKPNVDRRMRLQLYEPPAYSQSSQGGQPQVYQWWRSSARVPYPSTMYITVKGISPPREVEPSSRSMFATQPEVGRITYDELQKTLAATGATSRNDLGHQGGPSPWMRLAGQTCKVPNTPSLTLPAGKNGCFFIKFSHDGKLLACGSHDVNDYPIYIYEVPGGRLLGTISAHFNLIYELSWSSDDQKLLSASADGTSRVWDCSTMPPSQLKVLPHPSYVYTAKFHVRLEELVVTGGYDHVIRVWYLKNAPADPQGQLVQELMGHPGHINTLCFDEEGTSLYSADNMGQLRVWNVYTTDQPSKHGILRDWSLKKEINDAEIAGVSISCLQLHPAGRRLLLHCRDNTLRLMDLRVCAIMQRYTGALNYRDHLHSSFSPCGTFVVAGSEDSCAYVWNTETGDLVTKYTDLGYTVPVCDVMFHPHDHMLAFCAFGERHAVHIYKFDHKVARRDVELSALPTSAAQHMDPKMEKKDDLLQTRISDFQTAKADMMSHGSLRLQQVQRKLELVTNPNPGSLSPHARPSSLYMQQSKSQMLTASTTSNLFHPHSTMGSYQELRTGPSPHISINLNQAKPEFAVQGPSTGKDKVIALYDYHPQRSDELPLVQGMPVTVLYKDTANWWMGQLPSGQQGYFPANYVTSEDIEDEFQPSQQIESANEEPAGKTAAVVTKSGELHFISASEDEEPREHSARKATSPKKKKVPTATLR